MDLLLNRIKQQKTSEIKTCLSHIPIQNAEYVLGKKRSCVVNMFESRNSDSVFSSVAVPV